MRYTPTGRFMVVICAALIAGAMLGLFTGILNTWAFGHSISTNTLTELNEGKQDYPLPGESMTATGAEAAVLAAGLLLNQSNFVVHIPVIMK